VAQIRGAAVLNTLRFVREQYGPGAHERVLQQLPREHWGTFLGTLREASWEPVADLVAYMEAAQRVLAPDDAGFFKRLGVFTGQHTRSSAFAALLGDDPATAGQRAQMLWRSFYDAGRLEIVEKGEGWLVARILDFPDTRRSLCQRITGFWEGCFDEGGKRETRVVEERCALDGGPCCVMRVTW
jgi:hypothetical protein